MAEYEIKRLSEADEPSVKAIAELLEQLTPTRMEFSEQRLAQIVRSTSSQLYVMLHRGDDGDRRIVGMLTLGIYLSPTGRKVWVEDVVVDQKYRGRGLGRALIDHAVELCREELSPCTLMLTSNPARIEANGLYRSAGFKPKQTNVYKMNL